MSLVSQPLPTAHTEPEREIEQTDPDIVRLQKGILIAAFPDIKMRRVLNGKLDLQDAFFGRSFDEGVDPSGIRARIQYQLFWALCDMMQAPVALYNDVARSYSNRPSSVNSYQRIAFGDLGKRFWSHVGWSGRSMETLHRKISDTISVKLGLGGVDPVSITKRIEVFSIIRDALSVKGCIHQWVKYHEYLMNLADNNDAFRKW